MTPFLFLVLVFMLNSLFGSPCLAMEERPQIPFPKLTFDSSNSFTQQQFIDNQYAHYNPDTSLYNSQSSLLHYPPAEPEDYDYYNTHGSSVTNSNSMTSSSHDPYVNFPVVPTYSPAQDRSLISSNHYVPSQAIISPMDTNNQWQMQQYKESKPEPQYIMIDKEDFKKLMGEIMEQKTILETLMTQKDEEKEVLIRIEQGQEQLADEIRGKFEKLHNELMNPHQSTGAKLYHWASFLGKAGMSIATSATTYAAITPILSIIAPPAIPIITGLSGLYMLAKLV